MKLPKAAPKLTDLFSGVAIEKSMQAVSTTEGRELLARANVEAWNFEECGHRAKLIGLTPEEFWLPVKICRTSNRQTIPLVDVKRRAFSFTILPAMAAYFSEIDLNLGGMVLSNRPHLEEQHRQRYLVRSRQEEAIASSLIEGALVTRTDAKEMIRNNRKPRTHGEQMVLNNYRTIRFLNARRDEPMTPELLCEIQQLLTEGAIDKPGGEGRFRKVDEDVYIHDNEEGVPIFHPPPAEQLAERMRRFCEFANEKPALLPTAPFIHPALRAVILHFWIGYDHPFVDGNGRTARALFYWSMLRQGYWLTEYLSISRIIQEQVKQYYRAYLNTEQDENDLTYFVMYHLKVLSKGIHDLREYLDQEQANEVRLAGLTAVGLNTRQLAIISKALQAPATRFSYASHSNSQGVTLPTARADLLDLEKRGLLISNRSGRAFAFIASADLPERITRLKRKSQRG